MPHEMAPPQPTPDELANRLLAEHANTEIQFHGRTMAFGQFVQLRAALCPVKPGELGAASDTEFMVNVLTDSKVELSEEYHPYIRQPDPDKPESNLSDTYSIKKNETHSKKAPAKKVDTVPVNLKLNQDIHTKYETTAKIIPKLHSEIMARVVQLESKPAVIRPTVETVVPAISRYKTESVEVKPTTIVSPNTAEINHLIVANPENTIIESSEATHTLTTPTSEVPINQSDFNMATELVETELAENINLNLEDFVYVPVVETDIETPATDLRQETTAAEALTEMPVRFEVDIENEKAPAVTVAEFILQVLPAVTQEVYERVQTMEPEAAVEVAARVETISIVADRLHELVVEGKTEGEEAKQIEVYLKREYEQLLVAVGIEPTEEILNDFIRYIYSAEYQIREDINLKEIEIIDEGTHEKKLFDEQGVFSRAHAASLNLSRRLDKSIGRLVVNYFSS